MPRTTAVRTPRKVRRTQSRTARYADRDRKAATPAERHKHAANHLLNAVANAEQENQHATRLAKIYDPDVRALLDHTPLTGNSAQLYRDQLDINRQPRAQLAQTLRLLRAVADLLDDPDDTHNHYAEQLANEAKKIDALRLNRGR